jgi:cobalt-zinc-cadmium efflux system outer membrane protein
MTFNLKLMLLVAMVAPITSSGCAHRRSEKLASTLDRPFSSTPVELSASGSQTASARSDALQHRATTQSEIRLASGDDSPAPQSTNTIENAADPEYPAVHHPSEQAAPQSPSFSLSDLEALALQNNPTLSQAQAAVAQEQGLYRQAGLYPNPQLGYFNSSAANNATKQSNGLFASQEFVTAGKLTLARDAAAQEVKRLSWDQEAQKMRVLNDLRIRYYEVLGAQHGMAVALRLKQIAEDNLASAEELFEARQTAQTDVLQARIRVETVGLSVIDARQRYESAWGQLATIVGVQHLAPTPLAGELVVDDPELDLETCWQQLLANSPQLRSSESELDHGWAEWRAAQAQAIPNLTLQTVAEYDKGTQSTTVSTLAALPIPISNRNQGNIDKAAADIRADQAEIQRVQLVLRDQLVDSFRRYKTSRLQANRLQQAILPDAEANLQLAMQSYKVGEIAFRDVLSAQETYAHSQIALIETLTELQKVVVEIKGLELTGGLNPAAIGSAIQTQPGGAAQRQRALLKELQDRSSKQLLPAAQFAQ